MCIRDRGYTKGEDEIILIMSYVDGDNLDRMIFGAKEKREVCTLLLHVSSLYILAHINCGVMLFAYIFAQSLFPWR